MPPSVSNDPPDGAGALEQALQVMKPADGNRVLVADLSTERARLVSSLTIWGRSKSDFPKQLRPGILSERTHRRRYPLPRFSAMEEGRGEPEEAPSVQQSQIQTPPRSRFVLTVKMKAFASNDESSSDQTTVQRNSPTIFTDGQR